MNDTDLHTAKSSALVIASQNLPEAVSWSCVQGWESIKELVVASVPTALKLAVRYQLQATVRPDMAAKLHQQVRGC